MTVYSRHAATPQMTRYGTEDQIRQLHTLLAGRSLQENKTKKYFVLGKSLQDVLLLHPTMVSSLFSILG